MEDVKAFCVRYRTGILNRVQIGITVKIILGHHGKAWRVVVCVKVAFELCVWVIVAEQQT